MVDELCRRLFTYHVSIPSLRNGCLAAGGVSRWLAAHPSYLQNVNRASAGLFIASGAAVLLLDRRR